MDRLLAMEVFEKVASERSFVGAARALNMSPPVVTRLVAELEAHLGARLFQRTTRRVTLTDAGAAYLGRVRQILQDVQEANTIASAHTNELAGRLRIHAPPVLASYVIAPLLSEFRQQYPGVIVDIDIEARRDLPIEDFDITLLGTDAGFNADIVARKIAEADVILVASPDYLARRGTPTRPEGLSEHDCLRLKRPDRPLRTWQLWRPTHPEEVVELRIDAVLMANHTDTLLRAAIDGAGITSVSTDIVAPYLQRGELQRVLRPWVSGQLDMYAALPSRKFVPQRSRVFLDFLVARTSELRRRVSQSDSDAAPDIDASQENKK